MEFDLGSYQGKCDCGKTHTLTTKYIVIESGATKKLGEIAEALGLTESGRVVCDSNTKPFADMIAVGISSFLCGQNPVIMLEADGLKADDKGVAALKDALPADTKYVIVAGSGTLHDLVRYVTREQKTPVISYPTACSVDAYASSVCAITTGRLKRTFSAEAPAAIIADTDVFSAAPYRLTASGISDMLGKYTSLADWKCGKLLIGEDFCEKIYSQTKKSAELVRENLPAIHAAEPDAYETLMCALIISGISMQMWGNSRPASGNEHHLAHFWEMGIINNKPGALHGEAVGVGLLTTLKYYEKIGQMYGIERKIKPYDGMPLAYMRKKLGSLYEEILKQNQPDILRSVSLEHLVEKLPELQQLVKELPKAGKLRPFMRAAGCVTTLEDIGLSREIMPDSIILAPFVRRRLTVMRASKLLPM